MYRRIGPAEGLASVRYFGINGGRRHLVLDLLGLSLAEWVPQLGGCLSLGLTCRLGAYMVFSINFYLRLATNRLTPANTHSACSLMRLYPRGYPPRKFLHFLVERLHGPNSSSQLWSCGSYTNSTHKARCISCNPFLQQYQCARGNM